MQQWQHAFILHTRPYSETSLLVDAFTQQNGRISLIAKGACRQRSAFRGLLRPFMPLIIHYSGTRSLKTLCQVEAISLGLPLSKERLYSAFYLNELILRALELETPYPELFLAYLQALTTLAEEQVNIAEVLRKFEYRLLLQLGYGVDFLHCAITGKPIEPHKTYYYQVDLGFCETVVLKKQPTFSGEVLLDFAMGSFEKPATLSAAKYFIKLALRPYIGNAPFKSRELFQKIQNN